MNRKNILETKCTVKMTLAKRKARLVYKEYKEKMKQQEKLSSLKELDKKLKRNNGNSPK